MRKMKNSGIEWIGDIPSEWKVLRTKSFYSHHKDVVGDEVDNYERLALTLGGVIKRPKEDSTGLQPEAFGGYQILRKNELVFKLIDLENVSTSRIGYSPYTGIVSPAYIVLKPFDEAESKFGEYYFLSMWQREIFNHMGDDGVRSSLNSKDLLNIPYISCPTEEKKKIVAFLDEKCAEIDTVIEKTKETVEEYKKLKQSVITQAVTKGIRPNRMMKDSGIEWIGKIPVDWCVRKLKTFTSQISKGATPKEMSVEKTDTFSVRFLKSENIVSNKFNETPEFYISESIHFGELKRSQLIEDDIMFVIAGASIGKVAIITDELLPANTNQAMSYIRVLEEFQGIKDYLWYVLQSDIMRLYITLYSVQSAQPNISMENLGNFRLSIPCELEEAEDIVKYLDKKCSEIDELIAKKTSLLSELESYKKSLIYEYVTGKKEVI